jgi:uncharacterized membrane protein YhaH (DUF805 family)
LKNCFFTDLTTQKIACIVGSNHYNKWQKGEYLMQSPLVQYYLACWQKCLDFRGRSRRAEFWYFVLCNIIVSLILQAIDRALGLYQDDKKTGVLQGIYDFAIILPSLAVGVRRLHDIGKSGWWYAINLVPCLGWIAFIIFAAQEGEPQSNAWGPNPKSGDLEAQRMHY